MKNSPVMVRREQIDKARAPSPWDLTNRVLYELCREHPTHTDRGAVLAKVQIIGRVYAASIERRRNKEEDETTDSFYFSQVAPLILESELDRWIDEARSAIVGSSDSLAVMVKIHKLTTELFSEISGLNKRSLASKYLHFHVPALFYIFDSRAEAAIRQFRGVIGSTRAPGVAGDRPYRSFATKCELVKSVVKADFGVTLSTRELDNLLLSMVSQTS
jgi:hypothetical protein